MIENEVVSPIASDEPPPEPEVPDVCFTPEAILEFVVAEAARIDPGCARIYQSVSSRRVKAAGWRAHDLMVAHAGLQRRVGRGARGGRRAHAAEVRRLLEGANGADLALARALLVAAISMLPLDSTQHEK